MKNIFYFIFTALIISCNNDKDINTIIESNKLLDSVIEKELIDSYNDKQVIKLNKKQHEDSLYENSCEEPKGIKLMKELYVNLPFEIKKNIDKKNGLNFCFYSTDDPSKIDEYYKKIKKQINFQQHNIGIKCIKFTLNDSTNLRFYLSTKDGKDYKLFKIRSTVVSKYLIDYGHVTFTNYYFNKGLKLVFCEEYVEDHVCIGNPLDYITISIFDKTYVAKLESESEFIADQWNKELRLNILDSSGNNCFENTDYLNNELNLNFIDKFKKIHLERLDNTWEIELRNNNPYPNNYIQLINDYLNHHKEINFKVNEGFIINDSTYLPLTEQRLNSLEDFIKYANPCNYNSSFMYSEHLNKNILSFEKLKLNKNDTSYYLNGKLYEGIVKVIDPEYGDNVEGNQYYTISKGRLNGPFYQQIAEGSEQLFGHYQNGKRHGSFTIMSGDLDCWPTQSVKYHMGNVQEGGDIEFLKHLF